MFRFIQSIFWLGLAAAQFVSASRYTPWNVGEEYVYQMHALIITDVPDLAAQSAGIQFETELSIQCRHAGSILVRMMRVTARRFHVEVADAWESLESTLGNETIIQGRRYLQEAFKIHHRDGMFQSIVVGREDPLWVVNMKKAIASKLQLNVVGWKRSNWPSAVLDSPLLRSDGDVFNSVFTVFEEDVTGECETLYEIASLSDGLIRSDRKLNPMVGLCADGTFFQVVKTKNYNKCRRNVIHNVVSPSGGMCPPDGSAPCAAADSRSSVSRYIACGRTEEFTLLKHTHQGEWRMHPLQWRRHEEQLRALSIVKLVLKSVGHLMRNSSEPKLKAHRILHQLSASLSHGSLDAGDVVQTPPQLRRVDKRGRQFRFEQLRRRVASLLANCRIVGVTSAHVVDAVASLARDVVQLDYGEIATIYDDVLQRRWRPSSTLLPFAIDLERELLLDVIMAAGSNAAVTFLVDAVINGRLTESEAIQTISGFPLFVQTPTPAILDQLFIMVKAVGNLGKSASVYQTAMQSISRLVNAACVNGNQSRNRFPLAVYGLFCSHDAPLIVNELVPYLANVARRHVSVDNRMVALNALAEIGHEVIIPVVASFLRQEAEQTTWFRVGAVLCLRALARRSNEQVRQILSSVFNNLSEDSQVRMAAFALLLEGVPAAHWWQKMAVSTWYEPDDEVVSFVYTTLYQLTNGSLIINDTGTASDRAQIVLPLAKVVPLSFSFNWIWSLPGLMEAYNQQLGRFLGPYTSDLSELESLMNQPKNSEQFDLIGRYLLTKPRIVCDLIRGLCGGKNDIFWMKWIQLGNAEVAIPNDFGLVVTARMQTHMLASLTGGFNNEAMDSSRHFNLDLKLRGVVKSVLTMTVDAECAGYSSTGGVDAQWMVDTPGHLSAALDGSTLTLSLKPILANVRPVYHHQVLPFTALKMEEGETMAIGDSAAGRKINGRDSSVRTERKTIATDWGFQLDSTIETEVGIDDLPALETVPIGSGSFVWASVTSARRSSHSVSLNPDTCAGETILFRFNLTTTPA